MKLDRSLIIPLLAGLLGFALILALAPLVRPTQIRATATPAPKATPIIYDFEGYGDDILTFDVPSAGPVKFSAGWAGTKGVFSVKIRNEHGGLERAIAMCHEFCDREALLDLDAGLYYAEVRCLDCDWYLVIVPLVQ